MNGLKWLRVIIMVFMTIHGPEILFSPVPEPHLGWYSGFCFNKLLVIRLRRRLTLAELIKIGVYWGKKRKKWFPDPWSPSFCCLSHGFSEPNQRGWCHLMIPLFNSGWSSARTRPFRTAHVCVSVVHAAAHVKAQTFLTGREPHGCKVEI